jgi:hypothetical protein
MLLLPPEQQRENNEIGNIQTATEIKLIKLVLPIHTILLTEKWRRYSETFFLTKPSLVSEKDDLQLIQVHSKRMIREKKKNMIYRHIYFF